METSIQVSREMHARPKERRKAMTFEELLERLLERARHSPRERFGAHPTMQPSAHGRERFKPRTPYAPGRPWHRLPATPSPASSGP